uniref:Venom protein n=1 Tax=Angiostrongylus cantonensis TaxID=6313 RepID=A0A0K0CXL2_ANGCA
MSQLVVLLLFTAQCLTQGNSKDVPSFCDEYAECMTSANQKAAECLEENTTTFGQSSRKHHCHGVLELHSQLQVLHNERDVEMTTCVRERSADAATLSARKVEKCKATLKKVSVNFRFADRRIKRKLKKEKKEKTKSCAKEAKKIRMHCAKLGKCCSVVKDCHLHASKRDEIAEKKKLLKKLYDTCHAGHSKKVLNLTKNRIVY